MIVIADNCTDDTAAVGRGGGGHCLGAPRPQRPRQGPSAGLGTGSGARPAATARGRAGRRRRLHRVGQPVLGRRGRDRRRAASRPSRSATTYPTRRSPPPPPCAPPGFILKHVIRSRGRARLGALLRPVRLRDGVSDFAVRRGPVADVGDRGHRAAPGAHPARRRRHLRRAGIGALRDAHHRGRRRRSAAAVGERKRAARRRPPAQAGHARRRHRRRAAPGRRRRAPGPSPVDAGRREPWRGRAPSTLLGRRRTAALAGATLAAQAAYVFAGALAAGASAASLRALVHAPGFAVARLRILTRVASGRRAQTWVRTTRDD